MKTLVKVFLSIGIILGALVSVKLVLEILEKKKKHYYSVER